MCLVIVFNYSAVLDLKYIFQSNKKESYLLLRGAYSATG